MKYSIDTSEAIIDGPRFVELAKRKSEPAELTVTGDPETGSFAVETEADLIAVFKNRPRIKIEPEK